MENEVPRYMRMNGLEGKTNFLDSQEVVNRVSTSCLNISDTLKKHCGPRGMLAMIADASRPDIAPLFTKDGVGIVLNMDIVNPVDRIVRDQILYIGRSVERQAGDGTTSAMMIISNALRKMITNRPDFIPDPVNPNQYNDNTLTYNEFLVLYEDFTDVVNSYIKQCRCDMSKFIKFMNNQKIYDEVYNEDPYCIENAIEDITSAQAKTSSHNDYDIMSLAIDTFKETPEDAWPYITINQEKHETDHTLRIVHDNDQYRVKCNPVNHQMMNSKMGTEFECDDRDLIVLDRPLVGMGDPLCSEVLEIVKDTAADVNAKPIVLICKGGDRNVTGTLMESAGPRVAVFTISADDPRFNQLTGLQCVSGIPKEPEKASEITVSGTNIVFSDDTLHINNIYEVEDEGDKVHPFANDPDSRLAEFLSEIEESIEDLEKMPDAEGSLAKEISNLKKLRNQVKYRSHCEVWIGGSIRDNAHARDVITDTFLATKDSLVNGFVPAGNMAFLYAVIRIENNKKYAKNIRWLATVFKEAILEVTQTLVSKKECETFLSNIKKDDGYLPVILNNKTIKNCADPNKKEYNTIPGLIAEGRMAIQPASIETTIIEKFQDVAARMLYTAHMVVPGAIND